MIGLLAGLLMAWGATAHADSAVKASLNGDVKSFFVSTIPYDNALFESAGLMPSEPVAQGIVDGRIKASASHHALRFLVHHAVTATSGGPIFATGQTGLGVPSPQFVDLTWDGTSDAEDSDAMTLTGRIDRLSMGFDAGPLTVKVGRQPITLGHGLTFTPLDLVNPFFPTTVDQEYKPGVDAITADLFFGTTTQVSVMTAYADPEPVKDADDWLVDGMVHALYAQHTLGVADVGFMAGSVQGDRVAGTTVATAIGPVAVHADATYTRPERDDEDPFVRAVVGALWAATGELTVSGEVYHQSVGASDPQRYLSQLSGDRYARGELWLAGQTYASTTLGYQVTPLILGTVAVIGNALDGSALVAPSAVVSVSDEVQLVMGGFMGRGDRPAVVDLADLLDPETGLPLTGDALNSSLGVRSEFGLYPSSVYVQMKAYF